MGIGVLAKLDKFTEPTNDRLTIDWEVNLAMIGLLAIGQYTNKASISEEVDVMWALTVFW